MIHAKENDFDAVKDIFYQHKEWFPHIRTDYMRREIAAGHLILDNEVVITYNFYKGAYRNDKSVMGDVVQGHGRIIMQRSDCILHQIAAKNRNGSASDALQRFFNWTGRRVWLSVRSDNAVARAFYERNGMRNVGDTSWTKDGVKNALPGVIYLYDKVAGPF
jgi:RimJ/RimL family protein N-acetyltransferase|tara:strand:+ start:75 stop:560 length:486 start_codon:yes stop_codon:yes gene_type:complete